MLSDFAFLWPGSFLFIGMDVFPFSSSLPLVLALWSIKWRMHQIWPLPKLISWWQPIQKEQTCCWKAMCKSITNKIELLTMVLLIIHVQLSFWCDLNSRLKAWFVMLLKVPERILNRLYDLLERSFLSLHSNHSLPNRLQKDFRLYIFFI